jgi:hypothetical protein
MRQIRRGDASYTLRLEFPEHWKAEVISEVMISIATTSGEEILAATSATLYTPTTLAAAADPGDEYITLAALSGDVFERDCFLLSESDDGPSEKIICHHYDSAGLAIYTEHELLSGHADGTYVTGLFATYDFDASTLDADTQIVITWTPDSDDLPVTEMAEISISEMGAAGFWAAFQTLYPSEYDMAAGRNLAQLEEIARTQFVDELKDVRGIDANRIVDQPRLDRLFRLYMRYVILCGSSDTAMYLRGKEDWIEALKALAESLNPPWSDDDQDGVKDDDERVNASYEIYRRYL